MAYFFRKINFIFHMRRFVEISSATPAVIIDSRNSRLTFGSVVQNLKKDVTYNFEE